MGTLAHRRRHSLWIVYIRALQCGRFDRFIFSSYGGIDRTGLRSSIPWRLAKFSVIPGRHGRRGLHAPACHRQGDGGSLCRRQIQRREVDADGRWHDDSGGLPEGGWHLHGSSSRITGGGWQQQSSGIVRLGDQGITKGRERATAQGEQTSCCRRLQKGHRRQESACSQQCGKEEGGSEWRRRRQGQGAGGDNGGRRIIR